MSAKKVVKKPAAKKAKGMTKAQTESELASRTGLTKAQVSQVLAAQADLVAEELRAGRPATIPGLVKVTLVRKPATAARPGRNPATGEAIMIKAKPARNVVRVRAVKALKEVGA